MVDQQITSKREGAYQARPIEPNKNGTRTAVNMLKI